MYKTLDYDIQKSFIPVALLASVPQVLVVNPNRVSARNLKDFIALMKKNPGKYNFASAGSGTVHHLAGELFKIQTGTFIVHIPYRGGSPAITDTIGGQVPLVAVNALEVLPHAKSGKLKVLAVLSPNRSANFPEAPTIAESGYPGFEASVWYGLVAPAATPKTIVTRLHAEVQKALQTREVRERMTAVGGEVVPATADQFGALIRSERLRYEKLVRDAQIKPD